MSGQRARVASLNSEGEAEGHGGRRREPAGPRGLRKHSSEAGAGPWRSEEGGAPGAHRRQWLHAPFRKLRDPGDARPTRDALGLRPHLERARAWPFSHILMLVHFLAAGAGGHLPAEAGGRSRASRERRLRARLRAGLWGPWRGRTRPSFPGPTLRPHGLGLSSLRRGSPGPGPRGLSPWRSRARGLPAARPPPRNGGGWRSVSSDAFMRGLSLEPQTKQGLCGLTGEPAPRDLTVHHAGSSGKKKYTDLRITVPRIAASDGSEGSL